MNVKNLKNWIFDYNCDNSAYYHHTSNTMIACITQHAEANNKYNVHITEIEKVNNQITEKFFNTEEEAFEYLERKGIETYSLFDNLIKSDTKYKHISETQYNAVYKVNPLDEEIYSKKDYEIDMLTKVWEYSTNIMTYQDHNDVYENVLYMLDKIIKCSPATQKKFQNKYADFGMNISLIHGPKLTLTVDFGVYTVDDIEFSCICEKAADAIYIVKTIIDKLENDWYDNFDIDTFKNFVKENFLNAEQL